MNSVLRDRFFLRLLFFGAFLPCALSGCVTQRRVVVGFSEDMEDHYTIYPSIEFDVVALTAEETDQIKNGGVDAYFAPGNALRKRVDPFTVYFSQERTEPETLPFRSVYWDRWLKKKPVTLALVADLPPLPDMTGEDPRVLYIDLTKDKFFARPVFVEIEPEKISRVFSLPRDPKTNLPAKSRRPDNRRPAARIHNDPESPEAPVPPEEPGNG